MPSNSLQSIYSSFIKRIDGSLALVSDIQSYYEIRLGRMRPVLRRKVYQIAEIAFLQLFVSWEDFLEQVFIRYMRGAQSNSGYSPRCFVRPKNLDHALEIVKGSRPYVDWTIVYDVMQRAALFFRDGEPFKSALGAALRDLDDMKTLRNSIAHRSKTSRDNFETLVRRILGFKPPGITPGTFLMRIDSSSSDTYLNKYADTLKAVARLLIP